MVMSKNKAMSAMNNGMMKHLAWMDKHFRKSADGKHFMVIDKAFDITQKKKNTQNIPLLAD